MKLQQIHEAKQLSSNELASILKNNGFDPFASEHTISLNTSKDQLDKLKLLLKRARWQIHSLGGKESILYMDISPIKNKKYEYDTTTLYHVTDKEYLDSILKNGLLLNSNTPGMNYPKRVYLYPTKRKALRSYKAASVLGHNFKKKNKDPILLQIDNSEHKYPVFIDPENYMGFSSDDDPVNVPTYTSRKIDPKDIKVLNIDANTISHSDMFEESTVNGSVEFATFNLLSNIKKAETSRLITFQDLQENWDTNANEENKALLMSIQESDDELDLDYRKIINNYWGDQIASHMEKCNISFDRENDEKIEHKIITIDQNQWDTTKCKVSCEAWVGGGDWQMPTMYFRCQVQEGYFNVNNESLMSDAFFVFIPDNTQGNIQLTNTNGKLMPIDGDSKESKNMKYNEKECWASLKLYLEECVQKEIQKVNKIDSSNK